MADDKTTARMDVGLLTVFFTAVTYAAAFTFNASYLSHFGIPMQFAQVDLKDLFVCGAGLLTFGGLIHGLIVLWPVSAARPIQERLRTVAFIWVTSILSAWYMKAGKGLWLVAALVCFGAVVVQFSLPMWKHKGLGSYAEKVAAAHASVPSTRPYDGLDALISRIGTASYNLLISALAIVLVAYLLGIREARNEKFFQVLDDCAILRKESDVFLCAQFDGSRLTGNYKYLLVASAEPVLRELGPFPEFEYLPLVPTRGSLDSIDSPAP